MHGNGRDLRNTCLWDTVENRPGSAGWKVAIRPGNGCRGGR